jgi:hypothetical protein
MLPSQNVSERIEYQGSEPTRIVRPTQLVHPSNATIALVFAYWSSWVLLGVGAALQNDALNVFDAWWMVLGLFWISANAVHPIYLLPNRIRPFGIAIAGIAAGMLIYGTFTWFIQILSGWSLSESRGWHRVVALPLRAVFASLLTAIVLTPQLRRATGHYVVPFLLIAGAGTGLVLYSSAIFSAENWRQHWLSGCIEVFETLILPLVMAAVAQRQKRMAVSRWSWPAPIAFLWKGELSLRVALLVIYPLTLAGTFLARACQSRISHMSYTTWQYGNLWATEGLLAVGTLVVGSMITCRALNHAAREGLSIARWLPIPVVLTASLLLLSSVLSQGFAIGNIITDSTSAALGGNYTLRVSDRGDEIELSGIVTYGLADKLAARLATHPGILRMRLNSPGGLIQSAEDAAQLVASHGLDTVVSKECSSACTAIFVAGKRRILEGEGRLGFHDTSVPDPSRESTHALRHVYASYGVDAQFITLIEVEHPSVLWYPSSDLLVAAGVLSPRTASPP